MGRPNGCHQRNTNEQGSPRRTAAQEGLTSPIRQTFRSAIIQRIEANLRVESGGGEGAGPVPAPFDALGGFQPDTMNKTGSGLNPAPKIT